MESPTTMAMVITAKNYPVACALLDPGFAQREKKGTIGEVVVINEVHRSFGSSCTPRYVYGASRPNRGSVPMRTLLDESILTPALLAEAAPSTHNQQHITVGNRRYSAEDFAARYRFSGTPVKDQFTKIVER